MTTSGKTVSKTASVTERLKSVRETIAATCAKANRELGEVTLIAVTKTASPEQVREVLSLGVTDLGESRVQNLLTRVADLNPGALPPAPTRTGPTRLPPTAAATPATQAGPRIRWHMIGHLQRNKVKQALPHVAAIHSVDSLRLAEELDAAAEKLFAGKNGAAPTRKVSVLLQVNASEEPQKFGVAVGAALHLGEQIASMPHLQLVGLMSMAAESADEKQARFTFARTREIFEEMKWHKIGGPAFKHLSMGMSNDYPQAILEGATLLRLGSCIFGKPAMPELDEAD